MKSGMNSHQNDRNMGSILIGNKIIPTPQGMSNSYPIIGFYTIKDPVSGCCSSLAGEKRQKAELICKTNMFASVKFRLTQ